jgi:hypothetical protein
LGAKILVGDDQYLSNVLMQHGFFSLRFWCEIICGYINQLTWYHMR